MRIKEQHVDKKENLHAANNFDELLDLKYGKIGTEKRAHFEEKAQAFVMEEMLIENRHDHKYTNS